ncbi:MAG: NupC/NupG family nucleoside CNT transporter [Saprospiraceae bacterium]
MDFVLGLLRGILGIAVLIGICYLLSSNRKAINWRLVGSGIALQIVFAILVLKVPYVSNFFEAIASVFTKIILFSDEGAKFLFAGLVSDEKTFGYIFAFRVLPTILFYSALSSVLYYFGILQKIVYGIAWVMSKTMRLSGPESLASAANVFIGQTEAPLFIKPYLRHMTRSEILCLMCGGMATIAGGVFAAYVGFLGGSDPQQQLYFAKHLLAASIMSAPAAIVAAKILIPETEKEDYEDELKISVERGSNLLDSIATGTTDGLRLAVNVGAMLIVFTALVFMCNYILENTVGYWTGWNEAIRTATNNRFSGFNFTYLLGLLFSPLAWVLGTPAADMLVVGQLLGQKTVLNEFVAYLDMGNLQTAGAFTSPKSVLIAIYALCGFSNFASIGIQIGGISALAPELRTTLTELGIKALIGGSIACFMTAVIAAVLF